MSSKAESPGTPPGTPPGTLPCGHRIPRYHHSKEEQLDITQLLNFAALEEVPTTRLRVKPLQQRFPNQVSRNLTAPAKGVTTSAG